ncbi:hypothetical protein [Roseimaritima ulvae]|uniref:Uncharacterized protein n=1 Tax=Roseimaritima ulvae TaxID=980254 RepID=A0A5B9QSQ3_9BACT|nr:hypothetical protein [Roseimaritima ulvae]QEG40425.1 hypothetical protein UC8_24370 [Roseimaritima ulvae]
MSSIAKEEFASVHPKPSLVHGDTNDPLMGTRALLDQQETLGREMVTLPCGRIKVTMHELSVHELRAYRRAMRKKDGELDPNVLLFATELLVARSLRDEAGRRMYSDKDVLAGAFNSFGSRRMECLESAANRLNGNAAAAGAPDPVDPEDEVKN